MKFNIEYTDTFSGEPNYSWVERATIAAPDSITDTALMRRAKAAVGLTGARGRRMDLGDTIEFRPYGMCTVLFISPVE